ncbi:MAG: alpha/beta hydrolase [Pirellulaceae bacterium]|nr:alpha/beta hydrolase [Planctomycetales bacterium]MCA9161637.1 alpha/beta hydrolase [Planctomycetales bacterium]MCA9209217.1 alpha/beta hydrolase [Planctomycetales bacterium]MCA9223641.1 alpha/beta hydrolase [Planctomycetales bacterium]MCA9228077.1 alpha/beta hydrolase [Planctomycetales bacterium]
MKRIVGIGKRLGLFFLSVYVTVLIVLLFLETSMVYPAPGRTVGDWQPVDLGHEDVTFQSADGTRLHGWYFEHPNPRAHVLVSHGNAQHVASMGPSMAELRDELGVSVFAYDYRGYGQSEGKPFESGVLADGEAAQRWLADRAGIATGDVVLFGRSIGGGVAVHLASAQGARALVLDRTFDSIVNVASRRFWWMPVRLLMRNRYDSLAKIVAYQGPLLQLHGTADLVVPYDSGCRLHEAAVCSDKRLLTIEGLGHNGPAPLEFWQAFDEMLERLPAISANSPIHVETD